MKILLFGTGKKYKAYKDKFAQYEIVYLLDNDKDKQGMFLDGIEIVSPSKGVSVYYDAVFILSVYAETMKEQLISLGVEGERIFSYKDAERLKDCVLCYGDMLLRERREAKKRILIFTDNLRLTGAQVVLLDAVRIFKNNNFDVIVVAQDDGPMLQLFISEDVYVVIDAGISVFHLTTIDWIRKLDPTLIFVNTIFMQHLFKCSALKIPVIWWLHDSEAIYKWVQCNGLNDYYHDNIKALAVSRLAREPFVTRCPDWPVELLPYGIKDIEEPRDVNTQSNKLVFATIGAIEERKGQDILFQAIECLSYEERKECEFWLIYQPIVPSDYADVVVGKSSLFPEVKMIGQIKHEKMGEMYRKISVLICPSSSDTLPTVTVEAMQNCIPCVVSDGTGTADYIENFKNGFVFPARNANILAERIRWMIRNKEKISSMGLEARQIYKKYFSIEVFEKNLMEIVKS